MTKAAKPVIAEPRAGMRQANAEFLRGTLHGWPRIVVRWLLLLLIRPWIKLTIIGLDQVPDRAAFLFVANHLHNADPILLEAALTRPVHFMAKKELFRYRPLAWGARFVGAFPVDRGRPDRAAIRRASALLASGVAVGMFPEGTRSPTASLQPGFPGAGLIAIQANVPILPATIIGTETLPWAASGTIADQKSRRPWFQRWRITIRFGTPYHLPREVGDDRVTAARATELMMVELARMLPESYRGVYADLAADSPPGGTAAPGDVPAHRPSPARS